MAITELRPFVCLLFLTDELSLTAEAEEVPSNNGAKSFLKLPLSKHFCQIGDCAEQLNLYHTSKCNHYAK